MDFPCKEANAFDAIWTASEISKKVDTTFFMPRLKTSKIDLKRLYDVPDAPMQLQSLYLDLLPDSFLLKFKHYFERVLSLIFQYHPLWSSSQGKNILYVRHPKELLFWGLLRERKAWLKNWILCYEAHDPLGLDPNQYPGMNPFEASGNKNGKNPQTVLRAAKNFDLVICNTQTLADDLMSWTKNEIQPKYIAIASPLPRLPEPLKIRGFGEKITLGYFGTVDQYRGVHILLEAMRFLPEKFTLRIVGKFRQEPGVDPNWFDKYLVDEQIKTRIEVKNQVPIYEVIKEIDQCDIVMQPASSDILDAHYASPQKSFDYMVRGKPIVAGDVPCHRILFQDGKSAALYPLNPKSLAECVIDLVNNPEKAEQIAQEAWEQSLTYNYTRKADELISAVKTVLAKR